MVVLKDMNLFFLIAVSLISLSQLGTAQATQTLSLAAYLIRVEVESPDLVIEKSMNEEAKARAQGLRLNPPMVGLMTMRDASGSNRGFEISQEIPFPTKIQKEKEVRDLELQTQNSISTYRKNEILLQARGAYFDFWIAFEKSQILQEKRKWLKNHVKISRSTARSDSAAQVHLLGTESEADLLENEILESATDLIEKRNTLKIFAPDLVVEDILPQEPKLEIIEVDPKSKSALIAWKENEVKMSEAAKSLKKQSYLPDFVIRYRSYDGNEMTARNEEVMVGITLPFLFFWQPQAESVEASARSQRTQAELRKTRVDFQGRLSSLLQKTESLKKQLTTLKDKLIPRAHKRMKLVENLSVRSMEGLDEHRTVMLDYLSLKLKALDARVDYEKTIIELAKLIGREATQ